MHKTMRSIFRGKQNESRASLFSGAAPGHSFDSPNVLPTFLSADSCQAIHKAWQIYCCSPTRRFRCGGQVGQHSRGLLNSCLLRALSHQAGRTWPQTLSRLGETPHDLEAIGSIARCTTTTTPCPNPCQHCTARVHAGYCLALTR